MKLHRLTAYAFGPFADRIEVDFDALGQAGIFLIQGPTGGGKTSILDAICFALYADVPGGRPAGRSLRSDHAMSDVRTSVSLEFTVGSRRLRVTRAPEQERAKLRGNGVTVVPSLVQLEAFEAAGRWATISTKAPEVGREIRDVVGLGLEQFSRVVLLPQGDFAAFLRAAPEERRALLGTLFDVSRYQQVEKWLADRAHQAGLDRAVAEQDYATAVQRVEDAVARLPREVLPAPTSWFEIEPEAVAGAVSELVGALHRHAGEAQIHHDQAIGTSDDADARLQRLLMRDEAYRRGCRAREVMEQLTQGAAQVAVATELLSRHTRAESVAGDLRALRDAEQAAAAAEAAFISQTDVVAAAGFLARAGIELDALFAAVTGNDDSVAEISRVASALTTAVAQQARFASELSTLVAESRTAASMQATLDERIADTQRRCDELTASAQTLPAATDRLAILSARAAAVTELQDLRAKAHALLPTIDAAMSEAGQAAQDLLDVQERRIAAMAGELATDLVDGEPCPVCGAPEHPTPALRTAGVHAEDVAQAQRRFDEAQSMAHDLSIRQAGYSGRITGLLAQVGSPEPPPQQMAELVRAAQQAVDDAQTAAAALVAAKQDLADQHTARNRAVAAAEARRSRVDGHQALLAAAAHTGTEIVARLGASLEAHAGQCPCSTSSRADGSVAEVLAASGGVLSAETAGVIHSLDESAADLTSEVASVVARHRAVRDALDGAVVAAALVRDRTEEVTRAARRAADECAAVGFESVQLAAEALLPRSRVQELTDIVQAARDARSVAEAILAEAAVESALNAGPVDIAAARSLAEKAKNARAQAAAAVSGAELACREVAERASQVTERAQARRDRRVDDEHFSRLAATVGGTASDNALRMRLSAFVLAGRLERVVDLANERLVSIGAGRYRLAHTDDVASHGRRSGLGLVVHDLWTGRTRDPATLSGGESFMASLALALGLADAVRQESGGFDLQTLFIDEGFGTLDEESLEHVMEILDTLRDGGRAVGVVSHVVDLRSRIPTQLRVHKSTQGSSVSVVGMPA